MHNWVCCLENVTASQSPLSILLQLLINCVKPDSNDVFLSAAFVFDDLSVALAFNSWAWGLNWLLKASDNFLRLASQAALLSVAAADAGCAAGAAAGFGVGAAGDAADCGFGAAAISLFNFCVTSSFISINPSLHNSSCRFANRLQSLPNSTPA